MVLRMVKLLCKHRIYGCSLSFNHSWTCEHCVNYTILCMMILPSKQNIGQECLHSSDVFALDEKQFVWCF